MSRQTMNDQELTELLDRERPQGFAHLVAAYRERIYWHIRRLVVLHEDAQGASQETFIRIYRGLDKRHRERAVCVAGYIL